MNKSVQLPPVVSIHGVPRSGTSWLGQIFNSHPAVAYRHQPLFSHRFKNRLDPDSSQHDISAFLTALAKIDDDDFLNDVWTNERTPLIKLEKDEISRLLVMKMVRYHYLVPRFLERGEDFKVIGIVRHPCAVLHSWFQADRDFDPRWHQREEWRFAPSKNRNRAEEYNGFEKWLEVANLFLEWERSAPNFRLVRYEHLVDEPKRVTSDLLAFCGLEMHQQVDTFLYASQSQHQAGAYALAKDPGRRDRWKLELDAEIAGEVDRLLSGTVAGARFAN